ncbi:unnamed protein product [Paramecium primaurelia]|uniref:COMM domain-containing protein 5 n=1 Tax=Paramecium primaurelia TaxID=5886 RepID=A0A8S1ND13_PARPR|nr:unnamed protein product [Paramecium primaurelia]
MDYNMKFVELLKKHENHQMILQVALDVMLQEKNYKNQLTKYRDELRREDKILVTKCTKALKELAMRSQQDQTKALEKISKIDQQIMLYLKDQVLPIIHFDRKLNNYTFIKYYTDPENSINPQETIIETQHKENTNLESFEADFSKLEWKLEITLSSIKMRKVIRPLILLIFHTKKGIKKTMYLDYNQFQEFRKNVALVLRQIHIIESIQSNF